MTTAEKNLQQMNDLISLCKRRGFFFQSSEIYGGLGSCWDYGPLGVELKNKVKQSWWQAMTERQDVVGVDCSILMHPLTWKASGHIDNFSDPLVDCKSCKSRFRADKIDIAAPCPVCKESNSFTEARQFNLMFSTQMGAVVDDSSTVYLRPETAQGIFVNFQNVQQSTRKKLPFGIAQIGKAFRNEITPGNFIFRTREFEQMEMQYFVTPGEQAKFMQHWQETRWNWHLTQGLRAEKLRLHPHGPGELAHYADAALDIEYEFPMGWGEMEGVHSRTDFDLKQHEQYSKKNLHYVDQMNNNAKYIPYVIETSVGLDRHILALLCDAYREEAATAAVNSAQAGEEQEEERIVLKLKPSLAPVQAAILPLMKKAPQEEIGQKLLQDLKGIGGLDYDTAGSIGKRYRRQDEVGTPFCLTVDFDSPTDLAVTVRHRDSMQQERVNLSQLKDYLTARIN